MELPLVGCGSHRLNLAVGECIGKEEKKNKRGVVTQQETGHRPVIRQVDVLMGQLSNLKNGSKLRSQTKLRAERKNATRWASLFLCLLKWQRIREHVANVESFPDSVIDKIPTASQNAAINLLVLDLKIIESVSKMLQAGGEESLDLFQCRLMVSLRNWVTSTPSRT
jgi:hypothetical protein